MGMSGPRLHTRRVRLLLRVGRNPGLLGSGTIIRNRLRHGRRFGGESVDAPRITAEVRLMLRISASDNGRFLPATLISGTTTDSRADHGQYENEQHRSHRGFLLREPDEPQHPQGGENRVAPPPGPPIHEEFRGRRGSERHRSSRMRPICVDPVSAHRCSSRGSRDEHIFAEFVRFLPQRRRHTPARGPTTKILGKVCNKSSGFPIDLMSGRAGTPPTCLRGHFSALGWAGPGEPRLSGPARRHRYDVSLTKRTDDPPSG